MAGKGSAPRKGANNKAYADNWEKIFGKHNPTFDAMEFVQTSPSAVDDAADVMSKYKRDYEEKDTE